MCTVTFFPKNDNSWLLSTNRDEMKSRPKALPPSVFQAGNLHYLAPVDAKAGGTWVGMNSSGLCLTLINNYQGENPMLNHRDEAVSRGLIIPELMEFTRMDDVHAAMRKLRVAAYNPFKLIGIQSGPLEIREWSWDGHNFLSDTLPVQPHIWVSTGKDYDGVFRNRKAVFDTFLKNHPQPGTEEVRKLHASRYPEPGAYSIAMELDLVSTVSNTMAISDKGSQSMLYHDGIPRESGIWVAAELTTTGTKDK